MSLPRNYKALAKAHRNGANVGSRRAEPYGRCECQSCRAVRKEQREARQAKKRAVPLLDRRAAAAEALLDKWVRQLGVAARNVAKHSKRVRYYERKRIEALEQQVSRRATQVTRLIDLPD